MNTFLKVRKMEVELKFRCGDIEPLKKKAGKLGFRITGRKIQVDSYFIVNQNVNKKRCYLRIREDLLNKTVSLDYHIVHSSLETEEIEVEVSSKESLQTILEMLGLSVQCVVKKQREEYIQDGVLVVFDSVRELGNFVELELCGTTDVQKLFDAANALGLKERIQKEGYPDLLSQKLALGK